MKLIHVMDLFTSLFMNSRVSIAFPELTPSVCPLVVIVLWCMELL